MARLWVYLSVDKMAGLRALLKVDSSVGLWVRKMGLREELRKVLNLGILKDNKMVYMTDYMRDMMMEVKMVERLVNKRVLQSGWLLGSVMVHL